MRCRHHPRARRTWETGGRWDHCPCRRRRRREECRRYLSLLKCSSCFVSQALSLLFHPFLIGVFHILFVLPTTPVCLSHRWRIMGEVCVTVVTIKLRHVAPQAVGNSVPPIRVFSNESALCIRWPKCWSFSFNINPSSEHPGLISFRMDWLNLLAVQGTLKSLLNTTVQKHQFFSTQLSLQSNSHIHT